MQTETLKNKTDSNHSKEVSSEITITAIEDVVQEKIVMIEIRTDTDKTTDQEKVTTTKTTTDNTLLILDLRTITSEIAHKVLRIEICAMITDPAIVETRTIGTIQVNNNLIGTISRTRYRESNSPRQDHSRSNSSNQSSRDNSRERNSNRFQFRDKKINGFFVDNQQGEFNLN